MGTGISTVADGSVAWSCFGSNARDCGFRTGSVDTGVVTAEESFTVMGWIHKRKNIPSNEWWHIFTDGGSGDILTVYGRNGGEWRTSMNNPSKGGVFTSGGRSVLTGPSGKKKFNDLTNGWHSLAIRYDQQYKRLAVFVDGKKGMEVDANINTKFKLRNFFGWGSKNANYKYVGYFGTVMVHKASLFDSEIMENHVATAPAHLSAGKNPLYVRLFGDNKKAQDGFSMGPGWFSSTRLTMETVSIATSKSWHNGQGFENNIPTPWLTLGPFSNEKSCVVSDNTGLDRSTI